MNDEQLEEILDDIRSTPELQLFFKKLFTDASYNKLFFIQRDELFPTENGNSLKYLFWNNIETNNDDAIKILTNQAELKSLKAQTDQESITGIYTEGIENPLKDLIMYVVIKYVRNNPDIIKLINDEKFDYSLMKQALRDYKKLDSTIFDEINKISLGVKIIDPDLLKLTLSLTNVIQSGQNNLANQLGDFLPTMAQNKPEIFFQIHANYQQHFKNVLNSSGLSKGEYLSVLKDVYVQKNIFNVHTMFWCSNCLDENIVLNSDSALHPSHMQLDCPRCSKKMLTSSVFQLDGLIEEGIIDQDGLIKLAAAWALDTNDIDFETIMDDKFEYDLVCEVPNNNLLIECRMHKSQYDDKTLENWIRSDLNQIQRHYDKIKDSHKIKHPIFLTNLDVAKNRALIEKIKTNFPQEIIYAHITALPVVISQIKSLSQQ